MGNCPSGEEYDAGLCYPICKSGYIGEGPVCWAVCPEHTTPFGAVCTKQSYVRSGTLPSCPNDTYESGLFCYPNCDSGFTGIGPVCWGVCPPDFPNQAGFCSKPPDYGRGAGHLTESGCINSGDHGAATNGCERYAGLWYPICDKGYHNYDCCICTPSCPTGFRDDGATCYKPSYPNPDSSVPNVCPDGKEFFGGFCYNQCSEGYTGFGASCFAICTGATKNTGTQCQRDSYGRGAGTIPSILSSSERTAIIVVGIIFLIFIIIMIIWGILRII